MAEKLNLKGERFGRLLVLHKAEDGVKMSQICWASAQLSEVGYRDWETN